MSVDNYCKLKLCLTESNILLRKIFLNRWEELFHKTWNDTKADALFFDEIEQGKKIKNQLQIKKFQILLETGNSKEWDISILSAILLSKPFLIKRNKIHIEKIKEIRNELAHLPDLNLTDERFDHLFESYFQSIKSLGCEDSRLNSLKSDLRIQNQRPKKRFDEDLEFLDLFDSAEKEFSQKHFTEALKFYSILIHSYEHSNGEYVDLYFKRSLTNLYIYDGSVEKDEKYIYSALLDAEKTIDYGPNLVKGYVQTAEIYLKLNKLEDSERFLKKALAIDCGNNDLKNSLANVRSKIGVQERLEHLDLKHLPKTIEESNEQILKSLEENQGISIENGKKTYEIIKNLQQKNDPTKADVFLGHEYRDGSKSLKQNYEMAAKYYGKAAFEKNAEALYNLALLHMKGLGVKKDFKIAISLLKQAASQPHKIQFGQMKVPNVGVKEAEHALGLAYIQGTYVEKNVGIAVYWYDLAVKHENGYSANNLALLYQQGDGVPQSFDKAEELFLFAHKLGNDHAITNLVSLYLLKNDPEQALVWHKRALENNCMIALSRNDEVMKQIENQRKLNEIIQKHNGKDTDFLKKLLQFHSSRCEQKIRIHIFQVANLNMT